jgi:hypothetical protein
MVLVTQRPIDPKFVDRRRHKRVRLALSGRYMLSDHHEHPCQTINISPIGLAVRGEHRGLIGERIVLYIDQVGRLEGMITRNFETSFGVKLQITPSMSEKLELTIAWLVNHQMDGKPDDRRNQRIKPLHKGATLTTQEGRQYSAALIDLSIRGAALNVDAAPPIGSLVRIGRTTARVSRHFDKGIAVEFDSQLPADTFDLDAKL